MSSPCKQATPSTRNVRSISSLRSVFNRRSRANLEADLDVELSREGGLPRDSPIATSSTGAPRPSPDHFPSPSRAATSSKGPPTTTSTSALEADPDLPMRLVPPKATSREETSKDTSDTSPASSSWNVVSTPSAGSGEDHKRSSEQYGSSGSTLGPGPTARASGRPHPADLQHPSKKWWRFGRGSGSSSSLGPEASPRKGKGKSSSSGSSSPLPKTPKSRRRDDDDGASSPLAKDSKTPQLPPLLTLTTSDDMLDSLSTSHHVSSNAPCTSEMSDIPVATTLTSSSQIGLDALLDNNLPRKVRPGPVTSASSSSEPITELGDAGHDMSDMLQAILSLGEGFNAPQIQDHSSTAEPHHLATTVEPSPQSDDAVQSLNPRTSSDRRLPRRITLADFTRAVEQDRRPTEEAATNGMTRSQSDNAQLFRTSVHSAGSDSSEDDYGEPENGDNQGRFSRLSVVKMLKKDRELKGSYLPRLQHWAKPTKYRPAKEKPGVNEFKPATTILPGPESPVLVGQSPNREAFYHCSLVKFYPQLLPILRTNPPDGVSTPESWRPVKIAAPRSINSASELASAARRGGAQIGWPGGACLTPDERELRVSSLRRAIVKKLRGRLTREEDAELGWFIKHYHDGHVDERVLVCEIEGHRNLSDVDEPSQSKKDDATIAGNEYYREGTLNRGFRIWVSRPPFPQRIEEIKAELSRRRDPAVKLRHARQAVAAEAEEPPAFIVGEVVTRPSIYHPNLPEINAVKPRPADLVFSNRVKRLAGLRSPLDDINPEVRRRLPTWIGSSSTSPEIVRGRRPHSPPVQRSQSATQGYHSNATDSGPVATPTQPRTDKQRSVSEPIMTSSNPLDNINWELRRRLPPWIGSSSRCPEFVQGKRSYVQPVQQSQSTAGSSSNAFNAEERRMWLPRDTRGVAASWDPSDIISRPSQIWQDPNTRSGGTASGSNSASYSTAPQPQASFDTTDKTLVGSGTGEIKYDDDGDDDDDVPIATLMRSSSQETRRSVFQAASQSGSRRTPQRQSAGSAGIIGQPGFTPRTPDKAAESTAHSASRTDRRRSSQQPLSPNTSKESPNESRDSAGLSSSRSSRPSTGGSRSSIRRSASPKRTYTSLLRTTPPQAGERSFAGRVNINERVSPVEGSSGLQLRGEPAAQVFPRPPRPPRGQDIRAPRTTGRRSPRTPPPGPPPRCGLPAVLAAPRSPAPTSLTRREVPPTPSPAHRSLPDVHGPPAPWSASRPLPAPPLPPGPPPPRNPNRLSRDLDTEASSASDIYHSEVTAYTVPAPGASVTRSQPLTSKIGMGPPPPTSFRRGRAGERRPS